MQEYFDADYSGPAFELFGTGHLLFLGVIVAVILYLPFALADRRARRQLAV